jgi:hypothetical protein
MPRRRHVTNNATAVVELDTVSEPATPHTALGTRQCDALGCTAKTGIPCCYVDRRSRACPTAWCPSHRAVVGDAVYCVLHGASVGGLQPDYGDVTKPEVDDPVPAMVTQVSKLVGDDIVAALREICTDRGEILVSDPVRRVFVGIERESSWERSWKVCSVVGISVRVSVAIFEADPQTLLARVNSTVVATLPAPERVLGAEPQPEEAEDLVRELVTPVAAALAEWERDNPKETQLMGRGPVGAPARPVPLMVLHPTLAEYLASQG